MALALLLYALSLFLPSLLTTHHYDRSIRQQKNTAESIKRDFAQILEKLEDTKNRFFAFSFPKMNEDLFALFKQLQLNPEREGISYCDDMGFPILWLGNIIDLTSIDRREGKGYSFQQE